MTDRTAQSEALLADERTFYLVHHGPRSPLLVARNALKFIAWAKGQIFTGAYSTGAGIAVSTLPYLALRGVPSYYIESATRVDRPSLTGRMLAEVPGVRTFTQSKSWSGGKWGYCGSVFDGYEAQENVALSSRRTPLDVVVTLGANQEAGFKRLVRRLVDVLPSDCNVVWQTGPTDVSDLPVAAIPTLPQDDLLRRIQAADVVIAHAGTGSALTCLEAGKWPILVPRRPEYGEHVDGHQEQLARMLHLRGLALVREADSIHADDLRLAQSKMVVRADSPPPLELGRL